MLYLVMEWREGLASFEMLYDLSCKSVNTEDAYIIISLKCMVILLNNDLTVCLSTL